MRPKMAARSAAQAASSSASMFCQTSSLAGRRQELMHNGLFFRTFSWAVPRLSPV
jgi:hypothetical protein